MRPLSLSFSGRADGRFRAAVSAAKNPVPGAEKVCCRELRLGAVAAGCALRLKSANVKKWRRSFSVKPIDIHGGVGGFGAADACWSPAVDGAPCVGTSLVSLNRSLSAAL